MKKILMLFFITSIGSVALGQKIYDEHFITFSGEQILGWRCDPNGEGSIFLRLQAPQQQDSARPQVIWDQLKYDLEWTTFCSANTSADVQKIFAKTPACAVVCTDDGKMYNWYWSVGKHEINVSLMNGDSVLYVRVTDLPVHMLTISSTGLIELRTTMGKSLVASFVSHNVWPENVTVVKNHKFSR